jgi:hypothetical protein
VPRTAKKTRKTSRRRIDAADHLHEAIFESWDSYVEWVRGDACRNWAFRGHADASWTLAPTLARELQRRNVNARHWDDQEQRIIHIFQRKALTYVEDPPVNAPAIGSFCSNPDGYRQTRVPYPGEAFANYRAKTGDPVAIGEPFFKPKRLIAQSGTFVYPSQIVEPVESVLRTRPDRIAKLVLRGRRIRKEALAELYKMNITHATLFPDLDGLARSVAYELEQHWAFDPTL